MHALECTAPGELRLTSRQTPKPSGGDVLLRIRRVGVCGTDFHIFGGNQPFVAYPVIMGQEIGAEVVSAPPGSPLSAGDLACVVPYLS